ncbi:Acyl-CoA synthetase (AMP-forming)/AMP-acid ligase II [Agreia bicolorata]|uniref:Acyl-CoA synthetase (AMP-forming)/AMP-acid ligase II n=1 Tax=Agreia bicolorata TaxID=110935 RepID=A0A1T4X4L9_9MICO|nr:AMP-binding protein [Agreia bicolorata]SKA84542.1 Acyl-CoA synthetase (AMP-forming)/AMP-acid ligase II [Agreia bicolorata]
MTKPGSILHGSKTIGPAELNERVSRFVAENDPRIGIIHPILDDNAADALVALLAVREAGGVPLVGDSRWSTQYWSAVSSHAKAECVGGDTAWASFSSGSSGAPRVILRSASSWQASFAAVTDLLALTADDVVYVPAPLASSLTLFSVAHSRSVGASILLPSRPSSSAEHLTRATVVHTTPQSLRAIVEVIEGGAPHSIRVALVGGDHLDHALRRRCAALGIRVIGYYGAAELSFVAVDDDGLGLRPFPGVQTRIVGGELWARSAYLASGYLEDGGGPFRVDGEGWGTVGDRAENDASGRLMLRGRIDGAILTSSATVIPDEVEAALRSIDGIDDAAVFGLPNERTGALVAALVQFSPGSSRPSTARLREQAAARLPLTHIPRRWFWTEDMPRTSTGKAARSQIRLCALEKKARRLD